MSALATTSADVGAASHQPTATEVSGFHAMAAPAEPLIVPPPPLIQPQLQSAQFLQVGSMPPTMLGAFQELPIPAPPQNVVAASQSQFTMPAASLAMPPVGGPATQYPWNQVGMFQQDFSVAPGNFAGQQQWHGQ